MSRTLRNTHPGVAALTLAACACAHAQQGRGVNPADIDSRVERGWVLNMERVDHDLRDFTLESVRRFMQTARVMQAALGDAQRNLARGTAKTGHASSVR